MKIILSVDAMRKSDAIAICSQGSGKELMYRAGMAVFEQIEKLISGETLFGNGLENLHPVTFEKVSALRRKAASEGKERIQTAVICGTGNNAGDGYVTACLLKEANMPCTIFCTAEKWSTDGTYYYQKCVEKGIPIHFSADFSAIFSGEKSPTNPLSSFDILADCLLGTGFRGEPRQDVQKWISAINRSSALVISVDINSGLGGDSGCTHNQAEPGISISQKRKPSTISKGEISSANGKFSDCAFSHCVISDITVSIGSFQPGHFLNMAKDVMRQKINRDIGIKPAERPYHLLEEDDFQGAFSPRPHFSNKSTYGFPSLIGGSARYSGAIRLSAMAEHAVRTDLADLAAAAMRCGAGVTQVAVPRTLLPLITPQILEATLFPLSVVSDPNSMSEQQKNTLPILRDEVAFVAEEIDAVIKRSHVIAFGMGIGTSSGARHILLHLLQFHEDILIVDADGLTLLSEVELELLQKSRCRMILTPHVKEMSRLLHCDVSEVQNDPIRAAETFARRLDPCYHMRFSEESHPGTADERTQKEDRDTEADFSRYADLSDRDERRVVLLKGPSTVVTDGIRTFLVEAGCPGMATAGSGDVLSGVLSAFCGYRERLAFTGVCRGEQAGILAVSALAAFVNGTAGEYAQRKIGDTSMIASDTVKEIPAVIRRLSARETEF